MLRPVSRREFIVRLKALGFQGPYPGAKHSFLVRDKLKLRIPNSHHSEEIGVALLNELIRQAEISRADWDKTG